MGLFDLFRQDRKKNTAKAAKERLQILIAHEHAMGTGKQNGPDYLPKLREEIIAVIRKYVAVSDNDVNFQVEKSDDYDMLELNITLPDK
jgi:cell division topological specificity factor